MFDIGFLEMLVIGMIALIVIGPKKLPEVARTMGFWLGKARRMMNEVKADIRKEMHEEDIKSTQQIKQDLTEVGKTFKTLAQSPTDLYGVEQIQNSVKESVEPAETQMNDEGELLTQEEKNAIAAVSEKRKVAKKKTTRKTTKKVTKKTAKKVAKSIAKKTAMKANKKKSKKGTHNV